ncbi:phycobilisome degradation protein NblB [Leptolyngbya sp. PCC 6406]|uniref:phycobilisome degradation protein NblB n=1 Tax=Leptolyngbya sp. PCC 6406 TaxID=1173264 RepID=UPI0002AC870D|nr:HEAT repeat domain-containing protein [Leptolyngbya sp. PCC 6406]
MTPTPESVKQLLESSDFGDRLRAINQIRDLDPAIAFELLQIAAADSNVRVRYAALSQFTSLGRQDLPTALAILRTALLSDPEPDAQAAAADAIGALQLTEAFDDLQKVYEESQEWLVQFSIIAALGELGEMRAFDLLQTALQSQNELIATAAIGSLGELGDPRALPLLLPYLDADNWQVRHRLVQALAHFDEPEAEAALQKLSQDTAAIVADNAKHYLAL